MKRIHPPKDFSAILLTLCALFMLMLFSITVVSFLGYRRLTKQLEYTNGHPIDLPEELTTIGKNPVPLEGFMRNDSIIIQFK